MELKQVQLTTIQNLEPKHLDVFAAQTSIRKTLISIPEEGKAPDVRTIIRKHQNFLDEF